MSQLLGEKGFILERFYFTIIFSLFRLSEETNNSLSDKSKQLRNLLVNGPTFNPDGNVKDRIKCLENAVDYQNERNGILDQTLETMSNETINLDKALKQLLLETTTHLESELKRIKQEADHRFDLQDAENRRLQQHVASLKAENSQLTRKLVNSFIC